jgi:hypothetical protein
MPRNQIALALLTRMSMPPKRSTVAATAARTSSSSRMSHFSARPCPPAAFTASPRNGWCRAASDPAPRLGGDRHIGAIARSAQRDGEADAARSAGDEQGLALQCRHGGIRSRE